MQLQTPHLQGFLTTDEPNFGNNLRILAPYLKEIWIPSGPTSTRDSVLVAEHVQIDRQN